MRTDGGNKKENINNCDNTNEEMRGENKSKGKWQEKNKEEEEMKIKGREGEDEKKNKIRRTSMPKDAKE